MNPTLSIPALLLGLVLPSGPRPDETLPPPPGMVLVPGGRTKIGSTVAEVVRLIASDEEAREYATSLLSETPVHEVQVDAFYLMATEVTNEQFAAYVDATGARPPESWGHESLVAAAVAYAEEQNRVRKVALGSGEKTSESLPFDPHEWWRRNWKNATWKMPAGTERLPVVFVSYEDATGYAKWAGLRLPTEREFQRAARGDGDLHFPWGDLWAPKKNAATIELLRGEPFPVGSFPDGASRQGVFDLVGNAWEWTSTPFTPYTGYESIEVPVDEPGATRRFDLVDVPWNARDRVVVGGSFQSTRLACRTTARRRTETFQTTEALGFRCAADLRTGRDIGEAVVAGLPTDYGLDVGVGDVEYRPNLVLALDRWRVREGPASDAPAENVAAGAATEPAQPAYAVIEGYDYIVFVPGGALPGVNQSSLREETSNGGPVALGLLSTNQPLASPRLAPGTYLVTFRGQGERAAPLLSRGEAHQPTPEEVLGLDVTADNFVFHDLKAAPVAYLPAAEWSYVQTSPGKLGIVDDVSDGGQAAKRLHLEVALECEVPNKGFRFTLPIRLAAGVLEKGWRSAPR